MTKTEITKKFDEIVAFAETEKFLDTPVKRYSSGMYVRLAFAVAAHLEPEVLLVDEVLAVGDAEFQKKCLGKMEDVAKEGRTILFVSHNMMAIKNLCSSALVLRQGRTEFRGDVSTAIEHYLNDKTEIAGEVSWDKPDTAPGDHSVRLKSVKIVSEGAVTGQPRIDKEIEVQIEYWNLEKDSRRLVSIHVFNSLGLMLFSSSNLNMATTIPDPWAREKYPVGLFRTTCAIPASLLNNGMHSLHLFINAGMQDVIIFRRNIISFEVQEPRDNRFEYLGEWLGAVRPKLLWQTRQLE
jgi:lipopolysaccharide transport system ATP-binding protein